MKLLGQQEFINHFNYSLGNSLLKVLVGSQNPVKINAVKEAFEKHFGTVEVIGIKVTSDVPDQPINDETFIGAENRARKLVEIDKEQNIGAKYFVGVEGGIVNQNNRWFAFGGMCVINKKGKTAFGSSPHFELPDVVVEKLLDRIELGHVMDEIMKTENSKHKSGAIGFFTNGVMDRKELYVQGLLVSVVPFLHENLYSKK